MPLDIKKYSHTSLEIFLESIIVEVHNLVSGNIQEQYNDPQNLKQVLTHWFEFECTSNEYNLFVDTRGQELTWEQFVSNHESLEKKIIYILELASPISQEDLLKKFPPLLEMRDLTTGGLISRYDSKNPTNMRKLIRRNQSSTLEAVEASLKAYGPRLDIWPTWNPYSIFVDPQGLIPLTWEELLISWGAEEIKTVYILYHETPENPLRWEDLTNEQIPSYARRVKWNYTAYFAARGYVLMDETSGMYVRTF